MKVLFIISSLFFALSVNSASLNEVEFADSVTLAGKKLVLNGMGIRKATWLGIKVYIGGLYLSAKSSNYNKFIASSDPKQISMTFVRSVDKKDLVKGWNKAFKATNKASVLNKIDTGLKKINSFMEDVKKGDQFIFHFLKDRVDLTIKGVKKPSIKGALFSQRMLSIWFINAQDKGLKKGLLGHKVKY